LLQENAECRRNKVSFALFYIDKNGPKAINDALGHDAGDQAIQTLAKAV
jgi:diguanylate cyclase (GGDEF)-like protein